MVTRTRMSRTFARALPRLTNSVNCADVERRIQVGSPEESQASALHVERRLNERIDEIEAIRAAHSVERSLERKLRRSPVRAFLPSVTLSEPPSLTFASEDRSQTASPIFT